MQPVEAHNQQPEDAFILMLETACQEFEILQKLVGGEARLTIGEAKNTAQPLVEAFRVQMAIAKSFLFNVRRANRICTLNKAALLLDRTEGSSFSTLPSR